MEFLTKKWRFCPPTAVADEARQSCRIAFPAFDKVRIGNQPEDRRGIEVGYGSDNVGRADEVIE